MLCHSPPQPSGQFIRFALVGLLNTGIHYAVFSALYQLAQIDYLVASVIGYCAGMVNSYLLNRFWTFRSRNARFLVEGSKFLVVNLMSLGVNSGLLISLVGMLGMGPQLGQLGAIAGSLIFNFVLNKYWTFRAANAHASK